MPRQLCSVCRTVPESFWSKSYDLFESRRETKVKLQSFEAMQRQGEKGCHFCTLLISAIWSNRLKDHTECLYLRRDYGDPHRAFCLATKDFSESLGKMFFFRVPDIWSGLSPAGLDDEIDNVGLMKSWLQTRSGPARDLRFLPTRLLDLQTFPKSNVIQLTLTKDSLQAISTPPYIALSHCWGGLVPIRLQLGNIKSWTKRGLAFDDLPKTFRDAVRVTRQLGCRYLWIDSMCIIQDCTEDWKQEASRMAEVYGNAYCTLAALSSKNSSEGCKLNPNIQASLNSPYLELNARQHQSARVRIFRALPRSWSEEFDGRPSQTGHDADSPLRFRAWVLQEKELSNCTIYFAQNQLLWENGLNKASSQLPWEQMRTETRSDMPRMMHNTSSGQIVGMLQDPWYALVEEYASRSLTVPTDKLVAFSGLAKNFDHSRKRYLAGIWSTDLPAALLWRVNGHVATRPAYLAPSWSWASLMGSITYDSLRLEPDEDCAKYEFPEDIYPGLKTLKVQGSQMRLEDQDKPYGNVQEGRIILSGVRCIRVECGQDIVRFTDGGQPLIQNKAPIGVFYSDVAGEAAHFKETLCVALQSESIRSLGRHQFRLQQDGEMISMVMGIIIARLPRGQGFKRVGMARWVNEAYFDAVSATTVELV